MLCTELRLTKSSGIKTEVRNALSDAITRILTPKTSTDILLSIRTKLSASAEKRAPYSMTFVGVNGVGKSTNLSKVAFWLLQNDFKVLIAACDTFRSGAVEQLRVHVRNLGMLVEKGGVGERAGVELYERGYGKDAAGIAKDAIVFGECASSAPKHHSNMSAAKDNGFDVVLIDTAGRMQDNEVSHLSRLTAFRQTKVSFQPLMRALAKLVSINNPDKIIFVGEALVGNEAVDQLTKFDRALKDFSSASGTMTKGRGIDGMLVTKWDTVDDKVISSFVSEGNALIELTSGRSCAVYDLRYGPADSLRWLWADIYGFKAVEGVERCTGFTERLITKFCIRSGCLANVPACVPACARRYNRGPKGLASLHHREGGNMILSFLQGPFPNASDPPPRQAA